MNQSSTRRNSSSQNTLLLVIILLIAGLILVLYTCRANRDTTSNSIAVKKHSTPGISNILLPKIKTNDEIVEHTAYTLSYNKQYHDANWVAYLLTGNKRSGNHYERTNNFLPDPLVKSGSAVDADYEGSGYDRGHLAPAEDMSWSSETMSESFFYSNMCPQVPAFNRGVWKRLEELVRYWSTVYDSIYIVTGPVLKGGLKTIGPDKVSVPDLFYKVVLEYNQKGVQGIGFVLPNEASAQTLKNFAVSIDSVEHLTGIDFFPALPDPEEESIEKSLDISSWRWTRKKASN